MSSNFVNKLIDATTSTPSSIIRREILIDKNKSTPITIIYMDSIVDKDMINRDILNPLMNNFNTLIPEDIDKYEYLLKVTLPSCNSSIETSFSHIVDALLLGKTIIIFDGYEKAIIIDTVMSQYRSIENPTLTTSLTSSKEDFNESLETNISIMKRRIRDKNLIIKKFTLGRRSKTNIDLLYIKNIVNKQLLDKVLSKVNSIDIDNIQCLGQLQQYIEEFKYSIMPQSYLTDSTEAASNKLTEGKIIILMEGSPYALCFPATLIEFFHTLDDYNQRTIVATFARLLRLLAIFILLTLPSLYIILTKYNPELIIDKYIQPIVSSRQGIPLSPFLEIFIMDLTVEFLREGGARLPSKVSQTLNIVSGVIIGDAAIQSKIISPPALFIVGIGVVCTFLIPNYEMALSIRLLKFPFITLSNIFGLLGFIIVVFFVLLYLFNINIYGMEFISFSSPDMKDTFIRAPLTSHIDRGKIFKTKDIFKLSNVKNKKRGENCNEKNFKDNNK